MRHGVARFPFQPSGTQMDWRRLLSGDNGQAMASASCSAALRFGEFRRSKTVIRHILPLQRG